jgi:hypothetical protein
MVEKWINDVDGVDGVSTSPKKKIKYETIDHEYQLGLKNEDQLIFDFGKNVKKASSGNFKVGDHVILSGRHRGETGLIVGSNSPKVIILDNKSIQGHSVVLFFNTTYRGRAPRMPSRGKKNASENKGEKV